MSDIPTRETVQAAMSMKGGTDRFMHAMRLLDARADGELMTREEWTGTLNMEAAIREARDDGFKYEYIEKYVDGILAAALGKDNE